MPRTLSKEARKEWRKLVPMLLQMKVLKSSDSIALANLCEAIVTLAQARKVLEKGLFVRSGDSFRINPALKIVNEYVTQVTILSREFGLTPSSRSRIVVTPVSNDGSLWDRLKPSVQAHEQNDTRLQ